MRKLLLLAVSFSSLVAAQSVGDLDKRLTDLEKAAKAAQSAGDNAWMLTSAALVLMMTGPGLALFYGGLVRRKNVLWLPQIPYSWSGSCWYPSHEHQPRRTGQR